MYTDEHQPARPNTSKDLLGLKLELIRLREPQSLTAYPSYQSYTRLDFSRLQTRPNEWEKPEEPKEILACADFVERYKSDGLRSHGSDDVALAKVVS